MSFISNKIWYIASYKMIFLSCHNTCYFIDSDIDCFLGLLSHVQFYLSVLRLL